MQAQNPRIDTMSSGLMHDKIRHWMALPGKAGSCEWHTVQSRFSPIWSRVAVNLCTTMWQDACSASSSDGGNCAVRPAGL